MNETSESGVKQWKIIQCRCTENPIAATNEKNYYCCITDRCETSTDSPPRKPPVYYYPKCSPRGPVQL